MITIRLANTDDAEIIADISRQTFYETFASQNTREDMEKFMSEQFTIEALIKEVDAEGNIFLLAYINEDLAGYVRMREGEKRPEFADKSSIEIARIYAIQSAIGKGVGKALMQKCLEFAIKSNKKLIWLGVWEKNEVAISFYTKFGFKKFAEHDFVLGNDLQTDWLMQKLINNS
ncbi:MAG: GNAT family N-acetyltransferase [Chitinophagaceae bacterium]